MMLLFTEIDYYILLLDIIIIINYDSIELLLFYIITPRTLNSGSDWFCGGERSFLTGGQL